MSYVWDSSAAKHLIIKVQNSRNRVRELLHSLFGTPVYEVDHRSMFLWVERWWVAVR